MKKIDNRPQTRQQYNQMAQDYLKLFHEYTTQYKYSKAALCLIHSLMVNEHVLIGEQSWYITEEEGYLTSNLVTMFEKEAVTENPNVSQLEINQKMIYCNSYSYSDMVKQCELRANIEKVASNLLSRYPDVNIMNIEYLYDFRKRVEEGAPTVVSLTYAEVSLSYYQQLLSLMHDQIDSDWQKSDPDSQRAPPEIWVAIAMFLLSTVHRKNFGEFMKAVLTNKYSNINPVTSVHLNLHMLYLSVAIDMLSSSNMADNIPSIFISDEYNQLEDGRITITGTNYTTWRELHTPKQLLASLYWQRANAMKLMLSQSSFDEEAITKSVKANLDKILQIGK
jgi:hypothetical protein